MKYLAITMVDDLFGACESCAYEAGLTLSQGVIEAFSVVGLVGLLGDNCVSVSWDHAGVGFILVRMECRPIEVHSWDLGPQLKRCALPFPRDE